MNQQERRRCSRKTLNPLPYINLPFDNGGIVLDVSEDGLRFRATSPVELSGPVPFWFTAHSDLISGEAELMWLDETKKIGGLRFTQLPQNACEQIRSWPSDPNLRPSIGEDMTLHIAAPEPPSSWEKAWGAIAARVSSASTQLDGIRRELVAALRTDFAPTVDRGFAKMRAFRVPNSFKEHQHGLLRAAGVVSLALVISAVCYTHRRQVGESFIRLGMRMSGEARPLGIVSAGAAPSANASESAAIIPSAIETSVPAAVQLSSPVAVSGAAENPADANASQNRQSTAVLQKPRTSSKKIFVQVAALAEETEARELADQLRRENFRAFVRTLPDDSLNRVVLGPYADPASARVELGKLKKAGFDSFIRRESASDWLGS
jgi:hypothetical protein